MNKDIINKETLTISLLIASTSIGAGMISQPALIINKGILPVSISFLIIYFYTLITSFIIVEICIESQKKNSFTCLAENNFGKVGKIIILFLYLFICYTSLASYLNGIFFLIKKFFHLNKINILYIIIILFAICKIIKDYLIIKLINNILFLILTILFIMILILNIEKINTDFIKIGKIKNIFNLLPILITSFSFQVIIPSIVTKLKKNKNQIKISISIGISISLFFFIIWDIIILNSVPENILLEAYKNINENTIIFYEFKKNILEKIINIFSIFVLATSFIGINWGLYEFIQDTIKIKNNFLISIIIIIPMIIISENTKNKIIYLLELSGVYGDLILNGIFPIFVKIKKNDKNIKNYCVILFLILFFLFIFSKT